MESDVVAFAKYFQPSFGCFQIIHPNAFRHLEGLLLLDKARNNNLSRASTSKPLVDSLIDELTITNDPGWSFLGESLVLRDRCNDFIIVFVPVDNGAKRGTMLDRASSYSHAIGQVLQRINLLSKVFSTYFFFPIIVQSKSACTRAHTHTQTLNTHAHARQISSLHVVAECRRCIGKF